MNTLWFVFMLSIFPTHSNVVKSTQGYPTPKSCEAIVATAKPAIDKEQPGVTHVFYCGKAV